MMETSTLPERLQTFYEGFDTQGERALDHLGDFFTADVHFRDPFRDTRGISAFRELFVRMFKQYRHVRFSDFRLDGHAPNFTITYNMHLRMALGPTFVTPMASVCRARDGKVYDLLDYYDFASGLMSPLPFARAGYRRLINALFL
jgi:ketosteroid isomerase-like protein